MVHSYPVDRIPYLLEQSIPERFKTIVDRYPERLVVKFRDRALSYKELDEASNRIAHLLLAETSTRSDSVALIFEHGIDLIVAMLGTLKAGKVCCAMDSHLPRERNKYILDDFQADLILTNHRNLDPSMGLANHNQTVLCIDEIDNRASASHVRVSIAASQPANVVYTSGSTGYPRGVVRTHQMAAANAVSWGNARELHVGDRLSLLHSVSFGTGQADLFMSLLNGASIFPFDVNAEGLLNLTKWLKEERITIFHLAPATFRELTKLDLNPDQFSNLRLIRLSGSAITRGDFDLYRSKFHRRTLLEVGMGSTEAEAICNAVVNQEFSFPKEGSPVGFQREGRKILVLDDDGRELAPGEIGEIAVKGPNIRPRYWRRADLNEGKFLHDPNGGEELTYRTGDWGQMSADGFVIHLGRKDLMVKIRGYRVYISEIERTLLQHPMISEAAVAAWNREAGENYLVGYIVAHRGSAPNASELKEFLRDRLPDYMIPSSFMILKALPLMNGKLDRGALPKPDRGRPELNAPCVEPRSPAEEDLTRIWARVLSLEKVGIHDNFFDLGGHSLTASRVISRVIQTFHLELPIKALFDAPTVAEMAAVIEAHRGKKVGEANLERMLAELESLSDDEARRIIAEVSGKPNREERRD